MIKSKQESHPRIGNVEDMFNFKNVDHRYTLTHEECEMAWLVGQMPLTLGSASVEALVLREHTSNRIQSKSPLEL